MGMFRRIVFSVLFIAGLLGTAGGAVAMVGLVRWGAAGWYYHYAPEYRLRCGQQALHGGEVDRAKEIALILEADGYKDHACLLRGEQFFLQAKPYAETNKPEIAAPLLIKSLAEFNKIKDKGALRLQAAVVMGKCFLYMHQLHEAEGAFLFALDQDDKNIDVHRGLASLYHDQGATSRAILHLEKVAELDPSDGRPWRLMALMYKDEMRWEVAIEDYEEALRRHLPPGVPEQDPALIRKELTECLVRHSDYKQALEVIEQFSPRPDDAAEVEALRAESLIGLGRFDEAQLLLDQDLKQYPNNGDLYRLRAQLHIEAKELEQAVGLLDHALFIDANDYSSRRSLVQTLRQLGREKEAAKHQRLHDQLRRDTEARDRLEREAATNPWDPAPRLRLADAWDKLGRPDLAAIWRRAAAACPPALFQELERKPEQPPRQETEKNAEQANKN